MAVPPYAERFGLWKPTTGEKGGATAPAVVYRGANRLLIPPPTREQLMAASANLRRIYKIED